MLLGHTMKIAGRSYHCEVQRSLPPCLMDRNYIRIYVSSLCCHQPTGNSQHRRSYVLRGRLTCQKVKNMHVIISTVRIVTRLEDQDTEESTNPFFFPFICSDRLSIFASGGPVVQLDSSTCLITVLRVWAPLEWLDP